MRSLRHACAAALVFAAAASSASAELVRIPVRGSAELRVAIEPQQGAAAYALIFAGGHGKIQLDDAGQPQGLRGNFLIRARRHMAARGIGLVLVDAPSDYQGEAGLWPFRMQQGHANDIGQAVALVRQRFGRPVWLVGTSAGSLSVASAARLTGAGRPDGLVFTSSITQPPRRRPVSVFDGNLAAYTGPALVMSHEQDGGQATPASDSPRLLQALASARPKKVLLLTGGSPPRSDPCEAMSQHGFIGIEAQAMNAIADFILRPGN